MARGPGRDGRQARRRRRVRPLRRLARDQKHEPLTILPVNLQDDTVPLEFDLAIGVRKTDAFLKYMLEFALDDKKDEIEKILRDYGVPLVQCSKCLVQGDLPAHGSYIAVNQQDFKPRPDLASPDQVVTEKRVEQWLDEGADITQELSNAINRQRSRSHQVAGDREGRRRQQAGQPRLYAADQCRAAAPGSNRQAPDRPQGRSRTLPTATT